MEEEREERKTTSGPELRPGYREFNGRNEFPSNMMNGVLAIVLWIGAMHFNALLLLLSSLFLPFSKFILFVLFLFHFSPSKFLIFSNGYFFYCTNSFLFHSLFFHRVIGLLLVFMFLPINHHSKFGKKLAKYPLILLCFIRCFNFNFNL